MRKSLVLVMIGLLMLGMSGNVWAGKVVAADLNCTDPAGCVQTNEISDGAVTEPKIAAGAVTDGKIAEGAVGTGKISNGAVTADKLADWSVTGTKIVDYSVTDTKIASGAVTEGKIADGAVTDTKITGIISGSKLGSHTHNGADIDDGSVTASKINDGAITDAKITGPISASKLEKPANVVVVAKSGGDFTSIQTAIDSITPTAENPSLIKVMPGIYNEAITMKSYVNLQGAGRDVTTIHSPSTSDPVISVGMLYNVTISGLTISGGSIGIDIVACGPTITENTITGNGELGVSSRAGGGPIIVRNIISGNGNGVTVDWDANIIENVITRNTLFGISLGYGYAGYICDNTSATIRISQNIISENGMDGVYIGCDFNPIINNNTISRNSGSGIVSTHNTTPTIHNNIVTGNNSYGVYIFRALTYYGRYTTTVVNNNRITNNGGDIFLSISPSGRPEIVVNISSNVYDTISGNGDGVGLYNVKSDGSAAPAP